MFHSRSAIPYPCSYTIAPLRLIATLQPGECWLLYSAKSWSTRADDGPGDGCLQPPSAAITKIVRTSVCRGVWPPGRPVMEYVTVLFDRIGILFVDRAILH
jgi:hypothetical protein